MRVISGTTAVAFALNAPEAYAAKQRMVTYVTSWAGYAHGQVRAKQSAPDGPCTAAIDHVAAVQMDG
jgi:hypothetical protein